MQNYVQPGEVVRVTASATRAAGLGMVVGRLYGFLVDDAVSGEPCELLVEGVVDAQMVAGVGNTVGQLAYLDPATGLVTKFSGGGRLLIGAFTEGSDASDPSARVRLNTFFSPA